MTSLPALEDGLEWLVDASGCSPAALRDPAQLGRVFARAVEELGLRPIGEPRYHVFPSPDGPSPDGPSPDGPSPDGPSSGGVTAMLLLSESHLTCHTFPERGFAAFNLYCCRPRPEWPWADRLRELIGAERVLVRRIDRPMSPAPEVLP